VKKKEKKLRLGNPELSRLWQIGDEILEDSDRLTIPTLEELLTPIAKEMDPEAAIEEQYKKKNDKVYQWKTLRLVSRTKLHYFAKIAEQNGINLEVAAKLENLTKKGLTTNVPVVLEEPQDTLESKIEEDPKIDLPAPEEIPEETAEDPSEPHTPVTSQPSEMEVDKTEITET